MLPAGAEAAEAFYRVVDAAYERRSLIVTSNIHPSGFDTIMPSQSPRRLSTGCFTMRTSSPQMASRSASKRPWPLPVWSPSAHGDDQHASTQCLLSVHMEFRCPSAGRRVVRLHGHLPVH